MITLYGGVTGIKEVISDGVYLEYTTIKATYFSVISPYWMVDITHRTWEGDYKREDFLAKIYHDGRLMLSIKDEEELGEFLDRVGLCIKEKEGGIELTERGRSLLSSIPYLSASDAFLRSEGV